MKTVEILRTYLKEVTTGEVTVRNEQGQRIGFFKSIELPWKDNKTNVSCIPEGEYVVEHTYSHAFKCKLYLITKIRDRWGVRIHPANYVSELRGCIALGEALRDINKDGLIDVTSSRKSVKEFEKLLNKEPFKIIIKKKI